MVVSRREKSSQSEKSHFFALRDEKQGSPQNLFCGVKKNREVCLINLKGAK